MKPYCYIYQNYDDFEVFPNIEKAIEFCKKNFEAYLAPINKYIIAKYEDGKISDVNFNDYIEKVELSPEEINDIILDLKNKFDESKKRWDEMIKIYGSITGSQPLHMRNFDEVLKIEINKKSYKWK